MSRKPSLLAESQRRKPILAELSGGSRSRYVSGYSLPVIYFALGGEPRFEALVQG